MSKAAEDYTIEDLQTEGIKLKDVRDGGFEGVQPKRIVVVLSDEEYERIGGTSEALKKFANRVSDEVNVLIAAEY